MSDEEFDRLLDIATSGPDDMRMMVASSPRTPDEIIFVLLQDPAAAVRERAEQQRRARGITTLQDLPDAAGELGGGANKAQAAPAGWHVLPDSPLVEGFWDGSAWTGQRRPAIILTTTDHVPGFVVARVIGLVVGMGHPAGPVWTSTRGRSFEAMDQALQQVRSHARTLGANAVVGVTHAAYTGGNRSAFQAVGVQVLGTAVYVAAPPDPPDPGR